MPDKVNILIVDDRWENLLALETLLKPLEQNIIKAASSSEALTFLLRNDAAVILLDMEMPDLDGLQTATLIREREKTRLTPIIFLTTVSQSEMHAGEGDSLGAVDYIFKPFVPEVLRSKVLAFVEMFRQGQEVQRQSLMLKAERDFASAILDTVAGFVLVLDASGRILRVNRAFEEVTGYTFDDVSGHFLYE